MSDRIYDESKLRFDFTESLSVIKADERGMSGLLSVDFIVETESENIFIEVKNISSGDETQQKEWSNDLSKPKQNPFLFRMGVKFKDTILKKWAMNEDYKKEIHYIVILKFDKFGTKQRRKLWERFHSYLPLCLRDNPDFRRKINLNRCEIYSVEQWNNDDYYCKFPIKVIDYV